MRKVILLSEFFPPEKGGIQWSLEVAQRVLGDQLLVVAPPHPAAASYDQRQPYTILRRSLFSGRGWPRWWWLASWLQQQKRGGAELAIFGHFSAAVLGAWVQRKQGLAYAILVHSRDLLVEQRRWPVRWFVGHALRRAEWVGVNSSYTASLVHAHGVPWSKISRTHPTVDDERVVEKRKTPSAPRLITVCRLVPRKNVAAVIEALGQLRASFAEIHYDIVGDGPEREQLEGLVRKLELDELVHFHGQVSEQKKWELLRAAQIAVMTPTVRESGSDVEGLGIFYLEAGAVGLPLVASPTGGVQDIVQFEKTGLLVDPTDPKTLVAAIERLLRNPAERQKFGAAARTTIASEFTTSVRNRRLEALVSGPGISNPPAVSIIIPAYQSSATIGVTLESIQNQTWPFIQTIVVDDGSTDTLEAAIQPWREKLDLIRQQNQGAPVARNNGAQKATGAFLLFVDDDTHLDPQLVEKMVVALLTHPDASYAYSDFRFGPKNFQLFEFSEPQLKKQNYIHTTSLLRRQDFPGFDPALKRFQDWDLWLTLLKNQKVGLWIPELLFRVQQKSGGMSSWLPSFVYQVPVLGQGTGSKTIKRYRQAEARMKQKHGLS